MAYIPLPAFRAPSGLDFSPLNSALDDYVTAREKNRLLSEQRQIGESLASQPQGASPPVSYEQPTNKLLSPKSTPAQYQASSAADFIKREEGFAPQAKWDVRQNSGGYGSRAAPGEKFTEEKANAYLQRDMQPTEAWIAKNAPNATPEQRTALHSFGYNLGTGALDNLKPQIQAGDWSGVAQRMQLYNKARTGPGGELRPLEGLTARRAREAQLLTSGAPAPTARPSGLNYQAGIQSALKSGNVALAMQLQNAQQEAETLNYNRQRQGTQDAMAAESHGLTIQGKREELQQNAVKKIGAIAQVIQSQTDPAKKAQMWQRFLQSDPSFGPDLQAMGVDPSDVEAGTRMLVAQAGGVSEATRPIEVNGNLVQKQPDGSYKSVYTAPTRARNLTTGEQKEVFEADEGVQAGNNVVNSLTKALELNSQAYSGPAAQTRGYLTSLVGADGGVATEDLGNVITGQVLENLKATFGAAPTEGERQILVDVQGSVSKSPEVRQRIYERAMQAANRRIEFNRQKAGALRSGEYFQPGFTPTAPSEAQVQQQAATPQAGAPVRVNTPDEAMKLPSGTVFQTPDGRTKVRP